MSTTRRKSHRLMSKEALKQHEADALKASKEKEKQQQKRLKSIDALIKRLSPRTTRKIKASFSKLHTVHHTKQQIRKSKKQEQQRKAKATRALNKRIKTEKLDKENAKVLKLLMEKRKLPLDVAVIIAKDRQSLQDEDKRKKKERVRLENELTRLKSNLPDVEFGIQSVEQDIEGIIARLDGNTSPATSDEEGDDWIEWNLQDARTTLSGLQQRQQEIISNVSQIEKTLKTLK